jgi:hypothetical protein
MVKIVREDYYFDEPGDKNTDDVIEAVKKRVELTGIQHVIVASTSGETALKFARALEGKACVICVSEAPYRRELNYEWPCLKFEYRKELERLGAIIIDKVAYVFHNSVLEGSKWTTTFPEKLVKETLYSFGQGLKVAVEVVLIAVAYGYLEPYQDVIGVGGSEKGADTAAIIRATYPATVFSKDSKRRLEIREIIAMPRKKKWYE